MTTALPQLGIGILYNPMLTELLREEPGLIDFLEVIPDSFWTVDKQSRPHRYLEHDTFTEPVEELAERVPIVLHSVDLSIGSSELFDQEHVAQIACWQKRFQSPWHSDHLSFSRIGVSGHDQNTALAIPVPYDEELLELVSSRVRLVQSMVPAPFLLENNVYFFDLPDQEMSEPEFLNRLCRGTGCGLLLDIHNVYANARNHGFDAREFVSRIDPTIIVELHIAGGDEFMGMYTDSHSGPVAEAVWENLDHALGHAPAVRAVTYEFHESYYRQLKNEGIRAQLRRARETLVTVSLNRMSLPEFQRALTDLVSTPEICRNAVDDPSRFAGQYDLTERELKRLLYSVQQPGMKVCWALHRANRFGPMLAILPLTCRALGENLRQELDAFWNGELPEDLQFGSEAERFASFLRRRVREKRLELPVVDVVSFELAMAELRFLPQRSIRETLARVETLAEATTLVLHPLVRLIHFRHDPERLLAGLMKERPLPPDLARGDYHLLVDGKDGGMAIRLLDARLANILNAFRFDIPHHLDDAEVKALLKAGLIARWPSDEATSVR